MSRVLFVTHLADTHAEYFPLGTAFLAAKVRGDGHEVRWLILPVGGDEPRLRAEAASFAPDAAVISSAPRFYCTCPVPTVEEAIGAARLLKSIRSAIRTIAVGPFSTVRPEPFLADGFDAVVPGEPETAIGDALAGRPVPAQAPYVDLSTLPPPARDLVDLSPFVFETHFARRTTAIQSSRGCAFGCRFCFINRTDAYAQANSGKVMRYRTPAQVVEEARDLKERHGIDGLFLEDPEFLLDRKRAEALCEALLTSGLDLRWSAQSRVPDVDGTLLALLVRAGCREVYYGLESGDPAILASTGKGIEIAEAERAFRLSREAGLRVTGSFILGLPGETLETARRTITLAKRLAPDHAAFHVYAPFPGTRWHDEAVAAGRLPADSLGSVRVHENRTGYRTDALSAADLEALRREAYRAFYRDVRFWVRSAFRSTPREAWFYARTALGMRRGLRTAERAVLEGLRA